MILRAGAEGSLKRGRLAASLGAYENLGGSSPSLTQNFGHFQLLLHKVMSYCPGHPSQGTLHHNL